MANDKNAVSDGNGAEDNNKERGMAMTNRLTDTEGKGEEKKSNLIFFDKLTPQHQLSSHFDKINSTLWKIKVNLSLDVALICNGCSLPHNRTFELLVSS